MVASGGERIPGLEGKRIAERSRARSIPSAVQADVLSHQTDIRVRWWCSTAKETNDREWLVLGGMAHQKVVI